ncbi:hypothetical protein BJ912DRAFT_1024508 [Pholiota molesta]|nr:hypothetical protein BJ912DRAFT_1024508 [Pholiota molesta]
MASPLPPAWSEHTGPNGIPYYFNALTQESTYVRPVAPPQPVQPAAKKEKAHLKTPIPGTDWIRVTTTEGNVFYNNKATKQSVWTVPEDLKAALEAFQAQELKAAEPKAKPTASSKRKAEEAVPVDEVVISKKTKVEEEEEEEEDEDEDEEEEEWQREAAQQLAAEAEEEKKRAEERAKEEELEAQRTKEAIEAAIPARVDLSIEEGKALFKVRYSTLLREKDINPLHPWDSALPKFIQDPRYVLLPSVAARREAFDEYCKERARELRQMTVKKEKAVLNPEEEFEKLLKDEVKSTRASWTDFRRTWKKDRRFYGWGRDDREREKRFRDFLKELGEQKRAAAQKAEADFFALLKEHVSITEDISWKEVKNRKIIYKDPRYDAVGSSSLREELFNTFVKGKTSQSTGEQNKSLSIDVKDSKDEAADRQERRNKAVKEREEKINAERRRLDADIERSKMGWIGKRENGPSCATMLTDAIREPQTTWDQALPQLKTDPRFTNSPLPLNRQVHLFHTHISHLRAKQLNNLHGLFEAHAPSLATAFDSLPLGTILSSAPATRLGFKEEQRERTSAARIAFDEMMSENAFVEFWGRLGKIGGEGVSDGLKIGGEDIGEAGEEDEKVDMKALAKSVDIREMEKVLKNDKRYIMFNHEYLSNLSAPKLSVHVSKS